MAFESYLYLVIWANDGTSVAYHFEKKPKLSFSDNKLVIATEDAEIFYNIDNYNRFSFENDVPTSIMDLSNEQTEACYDGTVLVFPKVKTGTRFSLRTLNGIVINERNINTEGTYSFSLASVPKGVCIVSIGNISYKILIK